MALFGLGIFSVAIIILIPVGNNDLAQSSQQVSSPSNSANIPSPKNVPPETPRRGAIKFTKESRIYPLNKDRTTTQNQTSTSVPEQESVEETVISKDDPARNNLDSKEQHQPESKSAPNNPNNKLAHAFKPLPTAINFPAFQDKKSILQDIKLHPTVRLSKIESLLTPTVRVKNVANGVWEITGAIPVVEPDKTYGTLTRTEGGDLTWEWNDRASPQMAASLSNAWIYLNHNGFSHKIAARIPSNMNSFLWDFKNGETKSKYAREFSTATIKNAPDDQMAFAEIYIGDNQPKSLIFGKALKLKIPTDKQRKKLKVPGTVLAEYRCAYVPAFDGSAQIEVEQRLSFRIDSVESPLTIDNIKKRNAEIYNKLMKANKAVAASQARLGLIANNIQRARLTMSGEKLKSALIALGNQQRQESGKLKNKLKTFEKYSNLYKTGLPNFNLNVLNKIHNKEVHILLYATNAAMNSERLELATSQN